jgi:predicted membrane protein
MPQINYGKIFTDAFKGEVLGKRCIPLVVLSVLGALVFIPLVFSLMQTVLPVLPTTSSVQEQDVAVMFSALIPVILIYAIPMILLGIVFAIVEIFLGCVVVKQAFEGSPERQVSFKEGAGAVKKKLLGIIAVSILIYVIFAVIGLLGAIPYIGGFLNAIVSVVLTLMFFVIYPYIVVGDKKAIDALSASVTHFFKNKLQVFIVWLVTAVIAIVIVLLFMIPLMVAMLPIIMSVAKGPMPQAPAAILQLVISNFAPIAIGGVILAAGAGIVTSFSFGVVARYYREAVAAQAQQQA